MKTYKLLKWYPSLMDEFLVGMTVSKEKDEFEIYFGYTKKSTIMVGKNVVENYPEFWEEVKNNIKLKIKTMNQTIYYSDSRSSEFSIEKYEFSDLVGDSSIGEMIFIKGHSGNCQIFLTSPKLIDELCVLLQQKKNEIWKNQ